MTGLKSGGAAADTFGVRRLLPSIAPVAACLALPAAALATPPVPVSRQFTGTLSSLGTYSFTVQRPGRPTGVIHALTVAANRLARGDYPYVWGGGHAQAGIASVGERGPGYNGRRRGFDCSGSVAAVLRGAGLWPAGSGVPNDAGVIRYLLRHHEIARGPGVGPQEVTLYDNPGVHIFMNIDGRFFGTSDGGGGGDRRGGPGWLDDGAPDAYNPRFRRYHFLPSVLRATTTAGFTSGFQYGAGVNLAGVPMGVPVHVLYTTTPQGTMIAQAVTVPGELTATGTVQSVTAGGSDFTLLAANGQTLSFPATVGTPLAQALASGNLASGDTVSVSYISAPTVVVVGFTVTAAATTPTTTTPTTTTPTTTTPTTTTPTTTTPTTTTTTGGTTTTTSTTPSGGVGFMG